MNESYVDVHLLTEFSVKSNHIKELLRPDSVLFIIRLA